MSVCAKFQLPSMSRSALKVLLKFGGGVVVVVVEHMATMSNLNPSELELT